jgi:hypothetical protein
MLQPECLRALNVPKPSKCHRLPSFNLCKSLHPPSALKTIFSIFTINTTHQNRRIHRLSAVWNT